MLGNAGTSQALADTAAGAATFNMGAGRDVATNPYLQSAISAAIRPVTQSYTDSGGVLQGIRSAAGNVGQYGGSRQGVAEGIAAGRYLNTVGDIASTMANQGYMSGMQNATQTMALAPQVSGMQTTAPGMVSAVGQQQGAYQQALIDAAINKWNYEQNLPSMRLAEYQNLTSGNYGGTSSGTTTAAPAQPKKNPLLAGAGGALAGAQLGSMIPGIGTSIGAGAGLLLGLLG
jgi:hypothetical protein